MWECREKEADNSKRMTSLAEMFGMKKYVFESLVLTFLENNKDKIKADAYNNVFEIKP